VRAAVRSAERNSAYGYGWSALTPGEHEIAILVAQGLTNAQVAKRLGISRFAVDGRLRRVFTKLAVSNRVELASEYLVLPDSQPHHPADRRSARPAGPRRCARRIILGVTYVPTGDSTRRDRSDAMKERGLRSP
jgi:DNA-binding CsgD family transcriptional regulator